MRWTEIIISGIITLVNCHQIHDERTDDETSNIVRKTRDVGSRFETVKVMTGHGLFSKDMPMEYNAYGQRMYDYLEPADGSLAGNDTPVWIASGDQDKHVEYRKLEDGIIGKLALSFRSPLRYTAMIMHLDRRRFDPTDDEHTRQFKIPYVPSRSEEIMRRKRGIKPLKSNDTGSDANVNVNTTSNFFGNEEAAANLLTRKIGKMLKSSNKSSDPRKTRSTEDVIYPTIMVMTDYTGIGRTYDVWGYKAAIAYQLAFWNAVDLRFRQFSQPKVRLRIAGFIIGRNPEATPYMRGINGSDTVDGNLAMWNKDFYWNVESKHKEFDATGYDFLITVTDTPMTGQSFNGKRKYTIVGLAKDGALCKKWEYYQRPTPFAIVRDDGAFDGVLTAAHEIGHLFGLKHDGSKINESEDCSDEYGYILSSAVRAPTMQNLHWSPCRVQDLKDLMRNGTFDCALKPKEFYPMGERIDRVLPGFILDDHRQCQARGYSYACEQTPLMCRMLQCFHAGISAIIHGGWHCHVTPPAVEGTVCGPKERCLDGDCLCTDQECVQLKHEIFIARNLEH